MNKTSLLITILLFAALAAGYWFYQSNQQAKISSWDLISSDAVAVVEITNYEGFLKECSSFPALASILTQHKALQMLHKIKQRVGGVTISLHPISADDFAINILIPVSSIDLPGIEKYQSEAIKSTSSNRTYNGSIINEYLYLDGSRINTARLDDLVLISTSPILIEGAIRLYNAKNAEVFRSENSRLFQLPSLQSDHGNIYINSRNLEKWLALFLQPGKSEGLRDRFGDGALVDLKVDSNRILLNGFIADQAKSGFIASFDAQQPTHSEIWSYISNRSAFVTEAKLSNPEAGFAGRDLMFQEGHPEEFRELDHRLKLHSIEPSEIREMLGAHIVSCYVTRGSELASVSFIELKGEASRLREIAFQVAEHNGDSVYHEYHSNNEIEMVDLPNLFFGVAYPLLPGTAKTYFTQMGGYLLTSDDVELIKYFLDDIDHEDTWGKSVEWSRYLRTTLQESNFNLYFDGKLTALALHDKLNNRWQKFIDTTRLFGIEKGAIQVSHLDAVYYLNSVLNLERSKSTRPETHQITRFELEKGLRMMPSVVRNHDTKELEILTQDSLNNLQLFSKDLKRKWSFKMADPVRDQIAQIDYYRNGKLQYLLSTENELYAIDRLGRPVENFPVNLPLSNLEFFRVVDYDNSKNYRYLLVDKKGNSYLTNKEVRLLEGWNPRKIGAGLIGAVEHRRIYGRDYFIAIQGNGVVHLINRKGEYVPGFPVALNVRPQGSFAIQRGKDLASSSLVLVSEEGRKIQVDFKGHFTQSDVLPRFANNARFSLVNALGDESFVFFRVEGSRLAIIDASGNLLFETQNTGSDQWQLQYVVTPMKQKVFCLFDQQQNFSYLFNEIGRPIISAPFESDFMPTLMYDSRTGTFQIYNVSGRSISAIPIMLE